MLLKGSVILHYQAVTGVFTVKNIRSIIASHAAPGKCWPGLYRLNGVTTLIKCLSGVAGVLLYTVFPQAVRTQLMQRGGQMEATQSTHTKDNITANAKDAAASNTFLPFHTIMASNVESA